MRLRLLGAVLGLAGPFRYLAGVAVDEKDVETMARSCIGGARRYAGDRERAL